MDMLTTYLMIAGASLATAIILALASLSGFRLWIDYKKAELELSRCAPSVQSPSLTSRIEVADLKERIRKLEAIAAGVDL
jgi:hypothetical protein